MIKTYLKKKKNLTCETIIHWILYVRIMKLYNSLSTSHCHQSIGINYILYKLMSTYLIISNHLICPIKVESYTLWLHQVNNLSFFIYCFLFIFSQITFFTLNFHLIYNVSPYYQFARLTPQFEKILLM